MEHWMTGGKLLLAVMLMAGCAAPAAVSAQPAATNGAVLRYEEPKFLTGTIYTKGSDRTNALFRFTRAATRSGNTLKVLREFTQPDGKPAARERVVYEGDDLVSYELEELQTGGRGSAQIRENPGQARKKILFQYVKEDAANDKPRTRSEPLKKDALIADMVGPFLKAHWEELAQGKAVKCRYIVVPRRETVGFSFAKESASTWQGRSVFIIKMEPVSPIIGELVDPLLFTIEAEGQHRVLEYTGRTTPKIRAGNKWKDLEAVTVFDWK